MESLVSYLIGGLLVGSSYALVAVGFALIFSVTNMINLVQGAFAGLGALVMYTVWVTLGWPLPLALVVSVAVVTAIAYITERVVIEPALAHLSRMHFLILTSGLLIMFQGAALVVFGNQPFALPSFSGEEPILLGFIALPTQGIWIFAFLLAIVGGLWWVLKRTTFGMALQACAENPNAASLMGIPVSQMTLFTYAASGAIGAVGGIMIAPIASLAFDSPAIFTIKGFVAVILGGLGSFFGSILGGLTLGVLEQVAAGTISSLFSTALALVVLLVMLIWRPQGILGSLEGQRIDVQEPPHRSQGYILPVGFYRTLWRNCLPIGALLLLLPLIVNDQGLLNSLVLTGIFFMTAIGLDLLMGFGGLASLGQAGFMSIGGYTSAILAVRYGVNPALGILAGIVLTLAGAAVLSLVTARLRGAYLAMATLAFGVLVESIATGLMDLTGGPSGLVGIPPLAFGPLQIIGTLPNYYVVWLLVGAGFFLATNLAKGSRGRALWAINTDQTAAQALGINLVRQRVQIFLISAAYASVAGSLYGFYFHFLSPDMVGKQASLDLLTMLVLGGEGTLIGPLLGVGILTFLPTLFQPLAIFKPLVEGLLLVIIILRFPGGLLGGLLDAATAAAHFVRRRLAPDLDKLPRETTSLGA